MYAAANFFAILLLDNFAAAPIKPNNMVRPNDAIKTSATTLDPQKNHPTILLEHPICRKVMRREAPIQNMAP